LVTHSAHLRLWCVGDLHGAQSLALFKQGGEKIRIVYSLASLAYTFLTRADRRQYPWVRSLLEESLEYARTAGFKEGIAWSRYCLGLWHFQMRDVALAEGRAMTPEQALTAQGHTVLSSHPNAPANVYRAQLPSPTATGDLTEREVEVLLLVARGLTDAQVAQILVVSPRTVNAHLRSIYSKLGITSHHAATLFALEHHLL
jgi:DNA-binding CsgD family transcriptional regulator